MITVVYRPKYNSLTMEGHAYSGEPGRDLVCSAASMLAHTLLANVRCLEAQGAVRDVAVEWKEGNAFIRCTPTSRMKHTVPLVYRSIIVGFELLAHDYPANISFTVIG